MGVILVYIGVFLCDNEEAPPPPPPPPAPPPPPPPPPAPPPPPPAPVAAPSFSATTLDSTMVDLAWDGGTFDTLLIERSSNGTTWFAVARPTSDTDAWRASTLTANTAYTFRATPFDYAGNTAAAATDTATTAAVPLLTPPLNVTLASASPTDLVISWTWPGSQPSSWKLDLQLNGGAWAAQASVPATLDSITKSSVTAGGTYKARMRMTTAAGTSDYSVESAPITMPAAGSPTATAPVLTAEAIHESRIDLAWTFAGDLEGVRGFRVERSEGDGVTATSWAEIGYFHPGVVRYADTGFPREEVRPSGTVPKTTHNLLPATRYAYRVRAYGPSATQYGPYSNIASEVTAAHVAVASPTGSRPWLIGADRLATIRASAAANSTRWVNVKAKADAGLLVSPPYVPTDVAGQPGYGDTSNYYIPAMAVAYQALKLSDPTLANQYADRCISDMLLVADDDFKILYNNGFSFRTHLPQLALGLDCCFDRMTTEQKEQVAGWLMDRSDGIWPETYVTTPNNNWAVGTPGNNYWTGFNNSGMAALASYGIDARAADHIGYFVKRAIGMLQTYTANDGRGGAYTESSSYDTLGPLAEQFEAYRTATGVALADAPGFEFFREGLRYWRHMAMPGMDVYFSHGDQPGRVPLPDMDAVHRQRMAQASAALGDEEEVGKAKYFLDAMVAPLSTGISYVTREFLFYPADATPVDYTADEPLWYHAEGPGLFMKRSSWDADAIWWGAYAGPIDSGHQDRAAGTIAIFAGDDWLTYKAGNYSASGLTQTSSSHNVVTVNGGIGQGLPGNISAKLPYQGGTIRRRVAETGHAYLHMVLDGAYTADRSHGGSYVLLGCDRKVAEVGTADALLALVVVDRVDGQDSSKSKEVNWQTRLAANFRSNGFSYAHSSHRLVCEVLAPSGSAVAGIPQPYGTSKATSSWAVRTIAPTGNLTDHFVHVLRVVENASPDPAEATPLEVTGDALGVEVGDWAVIVGKLDSLDAVTYITPVPLGNHLISDLTPGASYTVTIKDNTAATLDTIEIEADDQGVATFEDATVGAYEFVVS